MKNIFLPGSYREKLNTNDHNSGTATTSNERIKAGRTRYLPDPDFSEENTFNITFLYFSLSTLYL